MGSSVTTYGPCSITICKRAGQITLKSDQLLSICPRSSNQPATFVRYVGRNAFPVRCSPNQESTACRRGTLVVSTTVQLVAQGVKIVAAMCRMPPTSCFGSSARLK